MDSWKDLYDPNSRYKLGCETDSNWVLRRLNFDRKGTQLECLQKGFGYGESHSFFLEDKETLDEKQLENLHKTGHADGFAAAIVIVDGAVGNYLPKEPALPQRVEIPSDFLDYTYKLEQIDARTRENMLSPDVWSLLEEFQSNVPRADDFYFCCAKRGPNDKRHDAKTVFSPRNIRFLEESFSLKQISQVFDETDLQKMLAVRFKNGRLLFVLPDLTDNLAERGEQQDTVCEVNFQTQRIIFYCEVPASYWYARIMMQQFALPGEAWRLETFLVEDYNSLIVATITRMRGGLLSSGWLQALDQKRQRILLFLNALAAT